MKESFVAVNPLWLTVAACSWIKDVSKWYSACKFPAERVLPFAARDQNRAALCTRLQMLHATCVTRTGRHRHSKHAASVSVSTVSLSPPASELRGLLGRVSNTVSKGSVPRSPSPVSDVVARLKYLNSELTLASLLWSFTHDAHDLGSVRRDLPLMTTALLLLLFFFCVQRQKKKMFMPCLHLKTSRCSLDVTSFEFNH